MSRVVVSEGYRSVLSLYDTQEAIALIKKTFEKSLSNALNLKRVSAPLFVEGASGLNDDLNGVERPVSFDAARNRRAGAGGAFAGQMEAPGAARLRLPDGRGAVYRYERYPPR